MVVPTCFHGDVVFDGDGNVIADGAVVVGAEGDILAVGTAQEIRAVHAGAYVERVHGLVLPGLVNAHAHLELSHLRGLVAGGDGFFPWVKTMLLVRGGESEAAIAVAIERAIDELFRAGVATIGDVSNGLGAVHAAAGAGLAGTVFHEVYGYDRARATARLGGLMRERADVVGAWPEGELRYVPAPHTLYTLHPDVIRAAVRSAREAGIRTSMHVAEHPAEREFLTNGTGPVVDFARWVGASLDGFHAPSMTPIAYADSLGVLGPDVMLVHMTTATRSELDRVAEANAPVVLCPRSNLFIEGVVPPATDVLAAGLRPGLGTDSLASNSSLDVLAEARVLGDRFADIPASALLSMATGWGAAALDCPALGRLRTGTRPGVLAIEGRGADLRPYLASAPAARRWLVARSRGLS